MKFYDMPLNYDKEFFSEIPYDIVEVIKKLEFLELKNNDDTKFLNYIWGRTKEICKKYINTDFIKELGMKDNELFEDIKYHSIFTIYLAIINQNLAAKNIRECVDKYYNKSNKRNVDSYYLYINLHKKWLQWIKSMAKLNYNDGIIYSDFYYCFYQDLLKNNKEDKNEYDIYIDAEIFYETIKHWNDCPYNSKHSFGMTFTQLNKFYEKLEEVVNKAGNTIDKTVKAFTIERLFNISFVYKLSKYVQEKFKKDIIYLKCIKYMLDLKNMLEIKYRKTDKEDMVHYIKRIIDGKNDIVNFILGVIDKKDAPYVKDLINKIDIIDIKSVVQDIMYLENIGEVKKILEKTRDIIERIEEIKENRKKEIRWNIEYIINIIDKENKELDIQTLYLHNKLKTTPYIKAQMNGAKRLIDLSEIVCIPMVFSRNKYIDIICSAYEANVSDDYTWGSTLKNNFLYMNNYMIPILSKVYNYLIFKYVKGKYNDEKKTPIYIEKLLRDNIEKNIEHYNIGETIIDNKYQFRNDLGTDAYQVNVTEIIYNYRFDRDVFENNNNVCEVMENLNSKDSINEELLRSKYNGNTYYLNFPFNGIYSRQQIDKNEKL